MLITTGEDWDPWRLVILMEITLVLHAQNDRGGSVGPIEPYNTRCISRVYCYAKNTDEGMRPIETSNFEC